MKGCFWTDSKSLFIDNIPLKFNLDKCIQMKYFSLIRGGKQVGRSSSALAGSIKICILFRWLKRGDISSLKFSIYDWSGCNGYRILIPRGLLLPYCWRGHNGW